MKEYRQGDHTVFIIHLHLVWITKYRKPVLRKDVAHRARDLIREICRSQNVEIIKGHISKDHVPQGQKASWFSTWAGSHAVAVGATGECSSGPI